MKWIFSFENGLWLSFGWCEYNNEKFFKHNLQRALFLKSIFITDGKITLPVGEKYKNWYDIR